MGLGVVRGDETAAGTTAGTKGNAPEAVGVVAMTGDAADTWANHEDATNDDPAASCAKDPAATIPTAATESPGTLLWAELALPSPPECSGHKCLPS